MERRDLRDNAPMDLWRRIEFNLFESLTVFGYMVQAMYIAVVINAFDPTDEDKITWQRDSIEEVSDVFCAEGDHERPGQEGGDTTTGRRCGESYCRKWCRCAEAESTPRRG